MAWLTFLTEFLSDNDIYVGVPYAASRAALNIVNLKYHLAYASEGILFVAISPGFVATSEVDPSSCEFSLDFGPGLLADCFASATADDRWFYQYDQRVQEV